MSEKSRDNMINKVNSKSIFNFFLKDQMIEFYYIFVLLPDLNTGFVSLTNNF